MGKRAKSHGNDLSRRATSIEVARLAGVSQSTVSPVFSANNLVAQETTDRVIQAAHSLGYKPNAIARSLITRRTDMIGIVMAEITSPFYPYVWKNSSSGFTILVSASCCSQLVPTTMLMKYCLIF